ncbi:MAG: KH domain-containing protein [Coriobacteriia bacterium]|nr:KH domain-containing protein [Coriobacteriia bacterium]
MRQECIKEASSVAEALDAALEELGVQQDTVEYEVLKEPSRGVLQEDKAAQVRVWIRASYLQAIEAEREKANDPESVDEKVPVELHAVQEEELSDEELDLVADTAVETLRTTLGYFGITECTIEEYEGDEREIILDVVGGGDLSMLIGRHGRTLDALQVLVSAITNRKLGFRYPVVMDVEGYRHRRRQKVEETARHAAERAAKQRRPVKLRPMTPYERRIVHVVLRNDQRVRTESEGVEPFRLVVVRPR